MYKAQLARRIKHNKIIIDYNCLLLICFSDFYLVIDNDLLFISSKFMLCNWSHVRRDGNLTALVTGPAEFCLGRAASGMIFSLEKLLVTLKLLLQVHGASCN